MVVEPKLRKRFSIEEFKEVLQTTKDPEQALAILENRKARAKYHRTAVSPPGGISLREAARRYGIHHYTLSRWVTKYNIPILLKTPNETYVDEACLTVYVKRYQDK